MPLAVVRCRKPSRCKTPDITRAQQKTGSAAKRNRLIEVVDQNDVGVDQWIRKRTGLFGWPYRRQRQPVRIAIIWRIRRLLLNRRHEGFHQAVAIEAMQTEVVDVAPPSKGN